MKPLHHAVGSLAFGIMLTLGVSAHAQLQFTDVRVTSGGAIQLHWASESNAVYTIEYASELVDGGTVWQALYEDYPALETNTFWTDAGDYNTASVVGHPRDGAMRFYRVVQWQRPDGLVGAEDGGPGQVDGPAAGKAGSQAGRQP